MHRTALLITRSMCSSHPIQENGIVSETRFEQYISGPHWEPSIVENATTYWRCSSCHRESIYEQDLYRKSFHSFECEVRE